MFGRNRVSRESMFCVGMYECKCRLLGKRVFPLGKRFVPADASKLAPARLESVLSNGRDRVDRMPKFYSDACDTNETLIDVISHDMGSRRQMNNWHEGNAGFIIHRIRCYIREIGEFWNAVGPDAPVETKSSRKFDRLIRCRGRPASRRCCSGIPEMRLKAGRKGCVAARGPSEGSIHRGTVARGALSNQAGTKTMSTTGMTGQRTGSHEPVAHASAPGIARRHPPPE